MRFSICISVNSMNWMREKPVSNGVCMRCNRCTSEENGCAFFFHSFHFTQSLLRIHISFIFHFSDRELAESSGFNWRLILLRLMWRLKCELSTQYTASASELNKNHTSGKSIYYYICISMWRFGAAWQNSLVAFFFVQKNVSNLLESRMWTVIVLHLCIRCNILSLKITRVGDEEV